MSSGSPNSDPKRSAARNILIGIVALALLGGGAMLVLQQSGCQPQRRSEWTRQPETREQSEVTVFFSKYQGNRSILEDVERKIPQDTEAQPLRFALTELLKGPTSEERSQGFYSEIPRGTRLLGLKKEKSGMVINLSRQFASGGGSNSMQQRFQEVKKTAYSVDGVQKIRLAVEGQPLEFLGGEGLEVQESLQREAQ